MEIDDDKQEVQICVGGHFTALAFDSRLGAMIYELSLPLSAELARWPGDPPITREIIDNGDVCISRWNLGSHAGTHVDAPRHYHAGVQTVDQLAPESLLGPCRVLHLPDVPCITADILCTQELEGVHRLLLHTRNSRQWQENPSFFDKNYVALDCEAARLLVRQGIRLIGVDGLSVEPYGGMDRCIAFCWRPALLLWKD